MSDIGGASPATPTVPAKKADPRMIAAIVASALFMQNLDSSAVATALPAMARDLAVEPARLGAAITSYLVALTVFIPVSGWVADRFGAKRVFMTAIVVFTLASVLCGRATGVAELIGARVLQGVGGAVMGAGAPPPLLRPNPQEGKLGALGLAALPAPIRAVNRPPPRGLPPGALRLAT